MAARRPVAPGYFDRIASPRHTASLVLAPVAPIFAAAEPFAGPAPALSFTAAPTMIARKAAFAREPVGVPPTAPAVPAPLAAAVPAGVAQAEAVPGGPAPIDTAPVTPAPVRAAPVIAGPVTGSPPLMAAAASQPDDAPPAMAVPPEKTIASPMAQPLADPAIPTAPLATLPAAGRVRNGDASAPLPASPARPARMQPIQADIPLAAAPLESWTAPPSAPAPRAASAVPPPPSIHIGVVEVRAAAAPPPPSPAPRAAPVPAPAGLARGFGWRYGFGQS